MSKRRAVTLDYDCRSLTEVLQLKIYGYILELEFNIYEVEGSDLPDKVVWTERMKQGKIFAKGVRNSTVVHNATSRVASKSTAKKNLVKRNYKNFSF